MFFLADDICTDAMATAIALAGFVLRLIQWIVPIILIFLGTVDLVKAVIAGKEEDIKKNQGVLIKRVVAAVIVFLIPVIVSLVTGLIGANEWKECWNSHHTDSITDILNPDSDLLD